MTDTVILAAKRTPICTFLGEFASLTAPQLGAFAMQAALEDCKIAPETIEQVIFGHVLQAAVGQAPARQAMLLANLPNSCGAITLHKVCGSGMRAIIDAHNAIQAGEWDAVIAGGMESMSHAPHALTKQRQGLRMGPATLLDTMVHDGLLDPATGKHMGQYAELCASKYNFSRAALDAYALESYRRAKDAIEDQLFDAEITSVTVPQRKGDPMLVSRDAEPFAAPLEKLPKLRPAFEKQGVITAGNASSINDGAAALVVTSAAKAEALGIKPMARIVSRASFAQEPEWFTTAPAQAAKMAIAHAGLTSSDIDYWEFNEAFAAVAMAAIADLKLEPAKVNARGGAVALGHPIGCSGARIVVTLLHLLRETNSRYGCASICIGGGEATAVVVENLS